MEKERSKILERIYTIPLRKEWLKTSKKKRAKKAIKIIKEFLCRHMKIRNRDLKKIKIDPWVNRAVWSRGIKNPPSKIIVKATKYSDDSVSVEFVGLPKKFKKEEEIIKRKMEKEKKKKEKIKKEQKEIKENRETKETLEKKIEEKKEKTEEKIEEEKEKILQKPTKPEKKFLKLEKKKETIIHRKALEK